jgi:hypothetical protein
MSRESSRDGVRLIPTIPLKLDYNRIKGFIMNNTRRITLFGLVVFSFAVTSSVADDQTAGSNLFKSPRETLSLDQGWRFYLGDIPHTEFKANRDDALPVTVETLDKDGRPVPTANLPVEFEIIGLGAIIGLGNGDPTSHEPEKGNKRSLFNGLAQVIVQSQRDGSDNLVLRAKAEGLKPAETTISVKATPLYIH